MTQSAAARELARRLDAAAVGMLRAARIADRAHGIGPAQMGALTALYAQGPMTLRELAAVEQVAQATMSIIVSKLVDAGAASKSRNSADGRSWRVQITAKGREAYEQARQLRLDAATAVLSRLSEDGARALIDAIEEVADSVFGHGEPAQRAR